MRAAVAAPVDPDAPDPVAIALRHRRFWAFFCDRSGMTDDVPLFAERDGCVLTTERGRPSRVYLARSFEMEARVAAEVAKILTDQAAGGDRYDGLVCCLCTPGADGPEPLLIDAVEARGPDGAPSPLLADLRTDSTHPFGGWGYAAGTHLGALSGAVMGRFAGTVEEKVRRRRYQVWAEEIFERPWKRRVLRRPVLFWARAWERASRGPWIEFGPTGVRSLVAQLVAVAESVFPQLLRAPLDEARGRSPGTPRHGRHGSAPEGPPPP